MELQLQRIQPGEPVPEYLQGGFRGLLVGEPHGPDGIRYLVDMVESQHVENVELAFLFREGRIPMRWIERGPAQGGAA